MNKTIVIFSVVFCLFFDTISGQGTKNEVSVSLEKLFMRLRQNLPDQRKLDINDSIRMIVDSYSASDTVFSHRFANIRYLGQITSTDSLVKLITWNLLLDDGETTRYFCNIIRRESNVSKNRVFRLSGNHKENPIRTDSTYSLPEWYGALYYDLRPFIVDGSVQYILLGIDIGNPFITRKIIDVLSFDTAEGIVFGFKCFTDGKEIRSRVVFEYSARAVMSLKFETDEQIVFDHLSPFSPDMKDNRQFYGPDFSYDSYKFDRKFWRYISDIDIKNR